jgi:hypothetical protein
MTPVARKSKSRRKRNEAARADRYVLYEASVQEPEADIDLAEEIFEKHYGRKPTRLREDFCGTALLACEWVKRHAKNRAWAIDLDPEPLKWGHEHNVLKLSDDARTRLELVEGNVMSSPTPPTEVICAFNFSYFLFRERRDLKAYFECARTGLEDEGLLILDAYGGADALRTLSETREMDGFDYVWDQHRYDPIQNRVVNYIHFEFEDGSKMKRAFRYEWRLWSLPELRDLLLESGFSKVDVYWEGVDEETEEGNGEYCLEEEALDDPAWVAYVVAYP